MIGDPMLSIARTRNAEAEAAICGGLVTYNATHFRAPDTATPDVLVRDDNIGKPKGGLLGHTSFGLFFLDLLYLPEELRGAGLGSRIIALAEDVARRRDHTALIASAGRRGSPDALQICADTDSHRRFR